MVGKEDVICVTWIGDCHHFFVELFCSSKHAHFNLHQIKLAKVVCILSMNIIMSWDLIFKLLEGGGIY